MSDRERTLKRIKQDWRKLSGPQITKVLNAYFKKYHVPNVPVKKKTAAKLPESINNLSMLDSF